LEIIYLNEVDSTHTYLKAYIKKYGYKSPLAVISHHQTNGIGSRDNSWIGEDGNLFLSFVIHKKDLPIDLQLQSASIYFSFILKNLLSQYGSKIWLKWPNDFYIDNKKVGGTITNLQGDLLLCGIGLNLKYISEEFGYLDIKFDRKNYLNEYFKLLDKKISWKQIFSKYTLEFDKSKQMKTTINHEKISLKDAILNFDGSIFIENKKVYSLR